MHPLDDRLAALSPEHRALLEQRLKQKGLAPVAPQARLYRRGLTRCLASLDQERLWFIDQLAGGNPAYNIPTGFCYLGNLDVQALERALNEVIRRHEALRTRFEPVDGQPYQVIEPRLWLHLPVVDLRRLAPAQRLVLARELASRRAKRLFDLARLPLLHYVLFLVDHPELPNLLELAMHHIVTDHLSGHILGREVQALYGAFSAGRPSPLAEPELQYADFALWQRELLEGDALARQLAYWRQALAGTAGVLDLPTDRPRPPVQSFDGQKIHFELEADLAERLRTFSRSCGVTPFVFLLALFKMLLQRYSGQRDVIVASPGANRNRVELEGIFGFFLNMLVLRTQVDPELDLRQLLAREREVVMGALAHQDVPFSTLVKEFSPERDPSRSALFQVSFLYLEGSPLQRRPRAGWWGLEVSNRTARFDFTLAVWNHEDVFAGNLEYNTRLFDPTTARRLVGHLRALIEAGLAIPAAPLGRLPMLPPAERQQVLHEWSRAAAATEEDCAAADVVERTLAHVRRQPEAIALVATADAGGRGREVHLSWHELERRSAALAARLQGLGVGPEGLVAVLGERSAETVLAMLGTLRAGGAYLPLDPGHPPARLLELLADSGATVLCTTAAQAARLAAEPGPLPPLVALDELSHAPAGGVAAPARTPDPRLRAYVIYTSGSTGRPKGVEVPHCGLAELVAWHLRSYRSGPGQRGGQLASPVFDPAVWEVWSALAAGATLCLPPPAVGRSVPDLLAWLGSRRVDSCFLSTLLAAAVLAEPELERLPLKLLLTGGERLHQPERPYLPCRVVNHYGPTEATVVATCAEVHGRARAGDRHPPIGRPLGRARAWVVDARAQLVPAGIPGELWLGGPGVARGYLRRPALTAERFCPDPFGAAGGGRLYRTGDLVRWRSGGELDFLGRLDHQLKVRGFRIEPGEVEAALRRQPEVREVVVMPHRPASGSLRLIAHLVLDGGDGNGDGERLAELRRRLLRQLPEYMVPATLVPAAALPRTATGKLDRRALERWQPEGPAAARAADGGAGNATEELLLGLWREVLKRDEVGVHDNFFELGGDSILCSRVVSRAHQAGLALTTVQIFQHQSVAELAAALTGAAERRAEQGVITGPLPLTPIQRWFFAQPLARPEHWNMALWLTPHQPPEPRRLAAAADALAAHHDALRLRFERRPEGWQQRLDGLGGPPLALVVDLSALPAAGRPAARQRAAAQLQASLDLARGPLLRLALFLDEVPQLLFTVHHLAVDMVSWRLLLEDLQLAYRQLERGNAVRLPAKTSSFKQWAEHLHATAADPRLDGELPWWQSQVRGGAADLPADFPAGRNTVASARTVVRRLAPEDTRALQQEVAEVYRMRLSEVVLAALAQALCRRTGERWMRLEMEGHGREELFPELDLERTVGWFTSMYPLRLELPALPAGGTPSGELLQRVKEQLRQVPAGGVGYGRLRYLRDGAGGGLGTAPPPGLSYNFLGRFDGFTDPGSLFAAVGMASDLRAPEDPRQHELDVVGLLAGGQLELYFTYSQSRHREATVAALADEVSTALSALARAGADPATTAPTATDVAEFDWSGDDFDQLMHQIRDL